MQVEPEASGRKEERSEERALYNLSLSANCDLARSGTPRLDLIAAKGQCIRGGGAESWPFIIL